MPNNFPTIAQTLAKRVDEAITAMRVNLTENDSIASDNLRAGIDFNTQIFGTKVECRITMADYWKSVDLGQKPGTRVAVDKIMLWMAQKGIDGRPSIRQKKVFKGSKKLRSSIKTLNRQQIAQRIVNKIYRVGTKATYFASDVINETWQAQVAKSLQSVGAKDIRFSINLPKETRI